MIGNTLGHYKVTERTGAGGMGMAYRARDLHLYPFFAIEALPNEFLRDPEKQIRFKRVVSLFLRESLQRR